ncbi:MAG: hypothetical protein H6814_05720 [Phycisphaeraceae bacterium]|nr:hypothetical protein [Phycisphaeraceae bacterium]
MHQTMRDTRIETDPLADRGPRTRLPLFGLLALLACVAWSVAPKNAARASDEPVATAAAPEAPADFASGMREGVECGYSIRSRQVRQHQLADESINKWILRRTIDVTCVGLKPDPEIGPRVRVTIDSIDLTQLEPGKALRFSSEFPHSNVVGAAVTVAMEPIVGAALTLTLGMDGSIRKVEGADALLKEKELRRYSSLIVGEEAIDELLQPIFRPVARPAEGGESSPWTSERRLDFPGFASMDFDESWTMRPRGDGLVTFKVKSETTAEIDEKWPKGVLSSSTSVGSYTWDTKGGRLEHTEINRFYVVLLENDPDGPSIAGEEVLTISAPIGDRDAVE